MVNKKPQIIIVEDDELIRESYRSFINDSGVYECKEVFGNCTDVINYLRNNKADLILMDIGLPGISGIEGTRRIKKMLPDIDILAVTVHDENEIVFDALCAGASGYITKNTTSDMLLSAINEALRGGAPMSTNIARMVINSFHKSNASPLSKRETEVLQLLAAGNSYTMIADKLFINKETVRTHIKNIYQKLEVNSKAQAIEKASKEKLI